MFKFMGEMIMILHSIFIPPQTLCRVYCFHVVRPSRRFASLKYLEESMLDFHQTLQTCSYMQDKYFKQKVRARGQFY